MEPSTVTTRFDALVVGCGAVGSAVSYNLAKRGMKVIALDRFGLGHTQGSSHGQTRIIRLAYYEDSRYVPILRRAFESWRELEALTGKKLLSMTGGLMIGDPEGELVTGVLRSAKEHDISHRLLSRRELEDEFPAFTMDDSMSAVFEESAGVLYSEDCIEALVAAGREAGCAYRFDEPMTSWKSVDDGVEIETKGGRIRADKVVFAAGAWNKELLQAAVRLECERQVPFWFSPGQERCFGLGEMPVFIFEEPGGRFFYGIPDVGGGVKVARTHGGEACDPETIRRSVTDSDVSPVVDFVKKRMKKLETPPIASTTCLYTNTPDLNFALGELPGEPRITCVSACSGHGFKFASVMGEIVSDLVEGKRTSLDVSFLSMDRFSSA